MIYKLLLFFFSLSLVLSREQQNITVASVLFYFGGFSLPLIFVVLQ